MNSELTIKSESDLINYKEPSQEINVLKLTEEIFFQSMQEWKNTFDAIPDLVTVHDKDFNIIRANKAAREILNLPSAESTEPVKCYKYYHSKNSPPEDCSSCQCLKKQEFGNFEVFEPHLNRYLEIRVIPRYDNNNNFLGNIHIVKDITCKKETENMIQEQVKRISILNSIDKAITANLNLDSILHILTDLITSQLGIDAANVLLLNNRTDILTFVAGKGFRSEALKYTRLKLGESNAGIAATEKRIVSIVDLKKEPSGFLRSSHFIDEDFVSYLAVPLIAKEEVKGVLELFHRSSMDAGPEWLDFLDTISVQAAIAIDNASMFKDLQYSKNELMMAYDSTISGWSHALDMKDKETEGHSRRVTEMTVKIAKRMNIHGEELKHIQRGALLHDIGKMGIPDHILFKPGKLSDEEWIVMKRHPVYAYDMLKKIDYLKSAIDIPFCHHEKWDGTGYPRGLRAAEIPLSARIFSVVDVWDALSSDRPYRPAWAREKVIRYIKEKSGYDFAPDIVEEFLEIISSDEASVTQEVQNPLTAG